MTYKLGAVGLGHWFQRLYYGLKETEELKICKAAAVSDVFSKRESLRAVGLTENDYYRVSPGEPLPTAFFDGIDVVHISNPNEFHASQTMQALEKGKKVITEKAWGVDKKEFDSIVKFLAQNGHANNVYLHLHYMYKVLTTTLPTLLDTYTAKYGKVTNAHLTFFERRNEEDERRKAWLFSGRNGGLFMDWIHPFEILACGAGADNMALKDVQLLEVYSGYNSVDPTGVYSYLSLSGKHFVNNAVGEISVAKGVDSALHTKRARFYFEDNAYLELNFVDSEIEFTKNTFGNYQLVEQKNGIDTVVEKREPTGKNTAQLFVDEILRLCKGQEPRFDIKHMQQIFKPQWEYQKLAKGKKLIFDKEQVNGFLMYGVNPALEVMAERVKVGSQ